MIERRIADTGMETSRFCNFFRVSEEEVINMLVIENIETNLLLK